MRILIVNSLYTPNIIGGAERSVQFIAESLVNAGHDVAVVCLSMTAAKSREMVNGVCVYYVPSPNLYNPFRQNRFSKFLKPIWHIVDSLNPFSRKIWSSVFSEFKPDLVHTNNLLGFSNYIWKFSSERGVRVVHTIRDYYLLCPRSTMFKEGMNCQKICSGCKPFAYIRGRQDRFVSTVVGNSADILKTHKKYLFNSVDVSSRVIYNGYEAKNQPEKIAFDSDFPVFGFIGRISPEKGVELILNELNKFKEPYKLLIAGTGDQAYIDYLKSISDPKKVEFLGFLKPEVLYARINYLIVPSLWQEPLPRTVFEAYAHGIPVIASRRGGIPEIVKENITGFLFDPEVDGDFLRALRVACSSLSKIKEMEFACRDYSQDFLPSNVVKNYVDTYKRLVECDD